MVVAEGNRKQPSPPVAMDRRALRRWRGGGEYQDWRGHRIFLRRGGPTDESAGRLLLIHGFPTAGFDWARVWPELIARGFRLAAPDMLGFGLSAKPRRHRYSLFEQADLMEDLIRGIGWDRGAPVHVLAHDYGDTVAQELLMRAHEGRLCFTLGSTVFLNGGMFFSAINLSPMQKRLRDAQGRILQHLITRRRFRRSFAAIFGARYRPTNEELDTFFDLVTTNGGRAVLHAISQYLRERETHEERWSRAIARADVPIGLIYGPQDPISGETIARRFHELNPRAAVFRLGGVGHYPQVEAPGDVVRFFLALHRCWRTVCG